MTAQQEQQQAQRDAGLTVAWRGHCMAWRSTAWHGHGHGCGTVQHGMVRAWAWHGATWHGAGMACHGMNMEEAWHGAWHSMAQHV